MRVKHNTNLELNTPQGANDFSPDVASKCAKHNANVGSTRSEAPIRLPRCRINACNTKMHRLNSAHPEAPIMVPQCRLTVRKTLYNIELRCIARAKHEMEVDFNMS